MRGVGEESSQVGAGGSERTGEKRLKVARRVERAQKMAAGGRIPQQKIVIGNAGRGAHVLLEPGDDRNGPRPHRVTGQRQPEWQARAVHELRVPSYDAGVERHAQPAASRDVRALDGLGGDSSPAREGRAHRQEENSRGSHQRNGIHR